MGPVNRARDIGLGTPVSMRTDAIGHADNHGACGVSFLALFPIRFLALFPIRVYPALRGSIHGSRGFRGWIVEIGSK